MVHSSGNTNNPRRPRFAEPTDETPEKDKAKQTTSGKDKAKEATTTKPKKEK